VVCGRAWLDRVRRGGKVFAARALQGTVAFNSMMLGIYDFRRAGGRVMRAGLRVVLTVAGLLWGVAVARAEDAQLNIYNWADYIGSAAIPGFEKLTGINVVYDTYDSDSALEAKVMSGESGYDLVTTSTDFFSRQIKAGAYEAIDKSRLPNWKNLDPDIVKVMQAYDPGNAHAVPYLHGVNGFAYNVDMIKARMPNAPLDSLDMVFKPEIVSKFADCGVSFMDNAEDVLQLALNYLHLDPNTQKAEDYAAAEKLLLAVRPYVRTFDSAAFMNAMPNKDLCIAMSWSGDYETALARAKAAGLKINLAFTVPKEGACIWYDAWLIPAGATHLDEAYKFLNYMLDPQVIAATTNEIHYGNDNAAANQYVKPDILQNPAIYPTGAMAAHLYRSEEVSPATERLRTRSWTRIKTGE
jgi:putrescine transport system substrate-binding protein